MGRLYSALVKDKNYFQDFQPANLNGRHCADGSVIHGHTIKFTNSSR